MTSPLGPGGEIPRPASEGQRVLGHADGLEVSGLAGGDSGRYRITVEPVGRTVDTLLRVPPPQSRELDDWIEAVRTTGPWSQRDGGVGLMAQLRAARDHTPDTLICIGLDSVSSCPDRSSLLCSFPCDVVLGTLILADVVGARHVTMLTSRSRQVRRRLRPRCRGLRLRLTSTHNVYPSADPTLVVWAHALGRRRLPVGANPVDVGAMLVTPWTAIRIGRWCAGGGLDLVHPVFFATPGSGRPMTHGYALAGQPLSSLDQGIRWQEGRERSCVWGDPMTGSLVTDDDGLESVAGGAVQPVVGAGGELVTVPEPKRREELGPCIACGWCVEVCPTGLRPVHLYERCVDADRRQRPTEHLKWCIGCGLCSHVCPSSIPLAQVLRRAQQEFDGLGRGG